MRTAEEMKDVHAEKKSQRMFLPQRIETGLMKHEQVCVKQPETKISLDLTHKQNTTAIYGV